MRAHAMPAVTVHMRHQIVPVMPFVVGTVVQVPEDAVVFHVEAPVLVDIIAMVAIGLDSSLTAVMGLGIDGRRADRGKRQPSQESEDHFSLYHGFVPPAL